MHSNDEYFYNFLNLENKNIGVYHLNRPLSSNGDMMMISYDKIGTCRDWADESLKNITKYPERDAVILMSHEAQFTLPIIENLPKNVFCFDCVANIDHQRYCVYFYWFGVMQAIEKTGPVLCNLIDYTKKSPEYIFDCLLGTAKSHRDFVYNKINSSKFKEQSLTSYFSKTNTWLSGGDIDSSSDLKVAHSSVDNPSFVVDLNNINHSQYWIPYNQNNTTCMMSQLLPWRIYNNTWYSIITETLPTKAYHSEKTAKALLGGRIFVVFSGCGALRTLRQAGFQTFGDIIDESYDDIEDDNLRFAMAWQQVEALAQTDPYEIYKKFGHITQHNQQHFMNTNWDDQFRQNVYRLLNI